ncbi:MAG: MBL fold metallo-hydrolase [Nitrospinae bacterium]|nr:MBL fold metallo-hydrolase [Nitrospinota bacterium]
MTNTLKVITTVVGDYGVNCYIVFSPSDNIAVIIDPGADGKRLIEKINAEGLQVKYILNTHCHADHIGGVKTVVEEFKVPFAHSEKENPLLESQYNKDLVAFLGQTMPPNADLYLDETSRLDVSDNIKLEIIETPGHTPGGLCFLFNEKHLFTGDSLFRQSIGRTDFPLSNHNDLIASLRTKVLTLSDDVIVYPGHEATSTIGFEKNNNPFLR